MSETTQKESNGTVNDSKSPKGKQLPSFSVYTVQASAVETVQDFLIKLDIKPPIYLLKISIFSLSNDIVRLTKIISNLVKDSLILTFKVIFQCLKLVKSFQKRFSVKNI